ncbi:MAG: N-acetyltransferase [Verrucomicrobia bacterium]|nr:N-acetyltransferase [Verrucomicrobiota bacterium]
MLRIETVGNRAQLREFVRFPLRIYTGDSPWVPPIWREETKRLDRERGPFFEHSDAALFLARDDAGEPVGRIAAIRFNRHLEVYGDGTGFFGFFECVDDEAVAKCLFEAAAEWLRGQGLERMRGPASFTINEEIGLLIENFDEPPTLLTTWNPPYYRRLVESAGLAKAEDLLARTVAFADVDVRYLERLAKAGARNGQVTIRRANLARLEEEVEILVTIYAEAWRENWGAVPFSRDEFQKLAGDLKPFLLPDCTLIAECGGEPVGICVAMPDINVAVKACGGRLGPLGLLRFMLARRRIDLIRGLVAGVLKAHRNKGIESAFGAQIAQSLLASRYKRIEFSWMLESNFRVHRVLENSGAKVTKRWRVYEREL